MPQLPNGVIRFGPFEVEPQAGIIRKGGTRIRLQEQPFQVLLALLEKPGEVVTREELHEKVWKGEPFGDIDHRLNIAVNRIREALRDSADTPRYVETLPRRGYRFIAAVDRTEVPAVSPAAPEPNLQRRRWMMLAGIISAAMLAIAGAIAWSKLSPQPILEWRRLTDDNSAKYAPVLQDGARLYFRIAPYPELHIAQIPVSGGEPAALPLSVPKGNYYSLQDITPDGQELLLLVFDTLTAPRAEDGFLWTLRTADGSSRRVGDLHGRSARYSPDGKQIAFTSGGVTTPGSLWVASGEGSSPRRLVELKDREIVAPCWSRNGSRIAFGQLHRPTQEQSAWEIGVDGTGLRRLAPGFRRNHLPAGWTADRSLLLISAGQFWTARPRRLLEAQQPDPVQLSSGDPQFVFPVQTTSNNAFYAVGVTQLGQLQRFDRHSRTWEPHLGGISAALTYSRDGQRFAYLTHPGSELWVRHTDGSNPVQLTKAPMQAGGGRWSPDDKVIAFSARSTPDHPWSLYLVDSAGGPIRPACPKGCVGLDLAWMPDGKKIVYAAPVGPYESQERRLRLLDLSTGEVTIFPGSEGLHSPRISPDGSTLAALSITLGNQLVACRLSDGTWKKLPGAISCGWPSWSHDGTAIWYYHWQNNVIMRYMLRENRTEEMLPLKREEMTGQPVGSWFDLTPNDEPMILRRRDIQQIYALEWKTR